MTCGGRCKANPCWTLARFWWGGDEAPRIGDKWINPALVHFKRDRDSVIVFGPECHEIFSGEQGSALLHYLNNADGIAVDVMRNYRTSR